MFSRELTIWTFHVVVVQVLYLDGEGITEMCAMLTKPVTFWTFLKPRAAWFDANVPVAIAVVNL